MFGIRRGGGSRMISKDDAKLICETIGCSGLSRTCLDEPELCELVAKAKGLLPWIKEQEESEGVVNG
jgi:hypothetical protein